MATTAAERRQRIEEANERRFARSQLRKQLKANGRSGAALVVDIVRDPGPAFTRLYAWQLVMWIPLIGEVQTRRMLRLASVDPWTRVGNLSGRQRDALVVQLGNLAEGRKTKRRPFPPPPVWDRD